MSSPSSPPHLNTEPSAQRTTAQLALTGRDRSFLLSRWFSLRAALAGAAHTVRSQPNAWIEVTAIVAVTAAGWWFAVARWEWVALLLLFSLILALEAVNTAVEAAIDLVSPEYHPLAKIAKDAAAGALVFAVVGSVLVAAIIFWPKLWLLWG